MTETLEGSIHGHDVIEMIVESGRAWKRDELSEAIEARWGRDAKFHTCSAEGMDAQALIQFLSARGKFIESEAGVVMDRTKVCSHGE
jgi:probable metal-binding protein